MHWASVLAEAEQEATQGRPASAALQGAARAPTPKALASSKQQPSVPQW